MTRQASWGRRCWQPLKRLVLQFMGPRMVWGFVRGDGVYLPNTRVSNHTSIFARERLDVADHVFVGHFSVLDATWGLSIGEGCQIGFFTGVFTHSSHVAIRLYGRSYAQAQSKHAYFEAPVQIGAYSFLGAHSVVLPGSVIGRGSLVSAQAVVKGVFPDFAILAGNPARVVGDTRDLDGPYLRSHPELLTHYEAWAGPFVFPPTSER